MRLKNAVLPNEVVPSKSVVTSTGLSESIVMAAEKSGWKEKRGKMGPMRGIGIGSGNMQSMFYMGFRSGSTSFIKFNDDGSCTVFTGNCDLGQGNQTMFTQIASEEIGIDMKDIKLCYGDTEVSVIRTRGTIPCPPPSFRKRRKEGCPGRQKAPPRDSR